MLDVCLSRNRRDDASSEKMADCSDDQIQWKQSANRLRRRNSVAVKEKGWRALSRLM